MGIQYGINVAQNPTQHIDDASSHSGVLLTDPQKEVDISLLWSVWRLLLNNYVHPEEMDTQKMVFGAVRGLVAGVGDPYTLFMTPKENTDFRDTLNGHLEGIGARLSLKNDSIIVIGAIKGSPAEKAGLLPQDVILTVDGKLLAELSLDQVVSLIRGKKGTTVLLTVMRDTEEVPRTFKITRDNIQVPSTEYEIQKTATGSLGVLTINEFGADTIREVNETLKTLDEKNIKGLIIDLRYNGGGYLDGALDLTSMFLRDGKVVTVAGRDDDMQVHSVSGNSILPAIPLVVLINEGSASASEIFAGALKDHGRAKIIGTKSFGKGTVQEIIDLPGGSSLRVTIARWLTPNGTDLGKVGIVPDIVINRTQEDIVASRDPQMTAAQIWLLEGRDVMEGRKSMTGTGSTR
jgi:carboxyl-terminal processing protease